jgi:hypothetical protein
MAGLAAVSGVANAAFAIRGDAVFDDDTGLLWERAVNKPGNDVANWGEAKAYAEGLTLAGKDDWRLPTIAELTELYDDLKKSGVCTADCTGDRGPFVGIKSPIWSATQPDMNDPFSHSALNFFVGNSLIYSDFNNIPFAWAVRDGDVSDVPLPAAGWLLLSGLGGLGLLRRRRTI